MHKIVARYTVMTPMFLGGIEHNAELRPPSIKDALRFWWRALRWQQGMHDPQMLRQAEAAIFGSADTGQAQFLLNVTTTGLGPMVIQQHKILDPSFQESTTIPIGEGARYLGYGVMEAFGSATKNTKAGQLTRACLRPGFEFDVTLLYREANPEWLNEILQALKAFGLLGALGSKARKGYGSVALCSLKHPKEEEIWQNPTTLDALKEEILKLYGTQQPGAAANRDAIPEWTALSKHSRHVMVEKGSAHDALNYVGEELVRYRSWGKNGKILGNRENSFKKFKPDHDLMKGLSSTVRHPKRVAFGLPHNYGKGSINEVNPSDKNLDRRASPLLVHVHPLANGRCAAIVSYLAARFLPEGSQLMVMNQEVPLESDASLRQTIDTFLNDHLKPGDTSRREIP